MDKIHKQKQTIIFSYLQFMPSAISAKKSKTGRKTENCTKTSLNVGSGL